MLKRLMLLSFFLLSALYAGAQEKRDSVYEFRFVPQKDMFFVPYGNNRAEYDQYTVTEGVRVRRGSAGKDYWGINQLGVTLVWKFN